jgi:hypothetical protein
MLNTINKTLNSVFSGKFNVLEDAYIIAIDLDNQYADYDGTTFTISTINPFCIDSYFNR